MSELVTPVKPPAPSGGWDAWGALPLALSRQAGSLVKTLSASRYTDGRNEPMSR